MKRTRLELHIQGAVRQYTQRSRLLMGFRDLGIRRPRIGSCRRGGRIAGQSTREKSTFNVRYEGLKQQSQSSQLESQVFLELTEISRKRISVAFLFYIQLSQLPTGPQQNKLKLCPISASIANQSRSLKRRIKCCDNLAGLYVKCIFPSSTLSSQVLSQVLELKIRSAKSC